MSASSLYELANPYWRPCPTCKGTGINPRLPTKVCPKCSGERKVPRPHGGHKRP
jgi:DnaJ-class molecular chaperone